MGSLSIWYWIIVSPILLALLGVGGVIVWLA